MKRSTWIQATGFSLLGFLTLGGLGWAEERQSASKEEDKKAETEGVFGETIEVASRSTERTRTDTPVPVDVLPIEKLAPASPQFDLGQLLQFTAPSYNANRMSGADGSDHIDAATLRGLGPDQTLVLVNGRRRHPSSLVYLFGSRGRGNVPTDLNTIPVAAIERIEILRDGAAAQYGSDAIAGVMNLVLRSRPGFEVVLGGGGYTAGDGEMGQVSVHWGREIGEGGNFNLTAEFLTRGETDRSPKDNPRRIGDAATDNATVFLNFEVPTGSGASFYGHAGYNQRDGAAGAWYRGGIGSDDIPSRNSAAMYPNGFVPTITTDVQDASGAVGYRGSIGSWAYDLSAVYGSNRMEFLIKDTLNASIATLNNGLSPTRFDAGGFRFSQLTTNFDLTRYYPETLQGLGLAMGLEYRRETYGIFAGEPGSYLDYDGPGGGNAGSQGFPGFQPVDEVDASRYSVAAYIEGEAQLTERFLVTLALRGEDYSDFGSTLDGKLALGWKLGNLRLRASGSTGFRAPSLQQRYFSSTFTDFISGEAADIKLAPNASELARRVGIPPLREEKSRNLSAGFAWAPQPGFELTLDAYRIEVDDRIVLTGGFTTEDPDIGDILAAEGLVEARFFTNAIDTRTNGVDLTFARSLQMGGGTLGLQLALNWNETKVLRINTAPGLAGKEDIYFNKRERLFVEGSAPKTKGVFAIDYSRNRWSVGASANYFGEVISGIWSQIDDPTLPGQRYAPRTTLDLRLSFNLTDRVQLLVGGANIFDTYPTKQNPDETESGGLWENVQMGFNGAQYFARLRYHVGKG
jgi:iron complex outermembrane receptor protein